MNIQGMSYLLLLLLLLLSQGVLVALLLLQANQNSKIQKGLLDRLLVKEGLEPLPDIKPFADLIGNDPSPDLTEKIEQAVQKIKRQRAQVGQTVRFNVPNANLPRTGMGS